MIDVFGATKERERSRVSADCRLSIPSQFLPYKTQSAKPGLKPFDGHVVVEMMGVVRQQGTILVPNADGTVDDLRPDIGRVLAAGERSGTYADGKPIRPEYGIGVLQPGTMVAVSTDHGKWLENAVFGDYHAHEQVRAYGVVADIRNLDYNRPRNIPWFSSILGTMNTTKLPVVALRHGETAPKTQAFHRGYRTAFSIQGDRAELHVVTLPCPDGKGFDKTEEFGADATYVVTWFSGFEPKITLVGDSDITVVEVIDEDVPIRPTHKKVLVERFSQVEQTRGGILLTAKEQFRPTLGKVISCGPECTEVRPGMTVLYSSRLTREVAAPWLPDRSFVMIEEDGIFSQVLE